MAKSESNPAEHASFFLVRFLQPLVTIGTSAGVTWPVRGYYGNHNE